MRLENHGQIAVLEVPDGWVERSADNYYRDIGARSMLEFHPPDAPDAVLCVYYRGLPMRDAAAALFRAVLRQPPHALGFGEIKDLRGVLQERADSKVFTISSARTEDLNGRRILWIEGRYKEAGNDLQQILLDADGTGSVVQEIYFVAPKDIFLKYARSARAALTTIVWRPPATDEGTTGNGDADFDELDDAEAFT